MSVEDVLNAISVVQLMRKDTDLLSNCSDTSNICYELSAEVRADICFEGFGDDEVFLKDEVTLSGPSSIDCVDMVNCVLASDSDTCKGSLSRAGSQVLGSLEGADSFDLHLYNALVNVVDDTTGAVLVLIRMNGSQRMLSQKCLAPLCLQNRLLLMLGIAGKRQSGCTTKKIRIVVEKPRCMFTVLTSVT